MKRKWIFFVAPPAAVVVVFLCGEMVKALWNWLLPALFSGVHPIGFWQALGLLLLCRVLFGSWGSGGQDRRQRRKKACMTAEEREQLRSAGGLGETA